jgi:hypothetical protein
MSNHKLSDRPAVAPIANVRGVETRARLIRLTAVQQEPLTREFADAGPRQVVHVEVRAPVGAFRRVVHKDRRGTGRQAGVCQLEEQGADFEQIVRRIAFGAAEHAQVTADQ